jgi:C4-dicarboxylate transporter, DctM subunit
MCSITETSCLARCFARIPVGQHARACWSYLVALLAGMMLIICIPELSLFLPRSAGLVR